MRPIHTARLDNVRPVLVLTREQVRPYLQRVTVVPVTSSIRGVSTEVAVGRDNGVDHDSVISCDNIQTIEVSALGPQIGRLLPRQEILLAQAITAAFDLDTDKVGD